MRFEWDQDTNRANIEKHGIDFADAIDIFNHPLLTAFDRRENYDEERWVSIGWMHVLIGVVVYTERHGYVVRIFRPEKRLDRSANVVNKAPETDWQRLEKMTDAEIETSEIPELDAEFFKRAELRVPAKRPVTLRLDADVLDCFKSQGRVYQTRVNKLLRSYMEVHQ